MRVTTPADPQPAEAIPPVERPAPPATQEHVKESVQEILPKISHRDNRVENAPEPKHILSLGNPHSNSNESP